MRVVVLKLGVALACAGCFDAYADHQPAYVVPGRPNIPVPINGWNASWGVVEGDFGLYRPGAVPVTVIPSPYAAPLEPSPPVRYAPARPYYPSLGHKPHYGRLEVEPPANRPMPKPAQSYRRSWSAESPKVPATEYAPSPPMMVSPEVNFNEPRQPDRNRRRR